MLEMEKKEDRGGKKILLSRIYIAKEWAAKGAC